MILKSVCNVLKYAVKDNNFEFKLQALNIDMK